MAKERGISYQPSPVALVQKIDQIVSDNNREGSNKDYKGKGPSSSKVTKRIEKVKNKEMRISQGMMIHILVANMGRDISMSVQSIRGFVISANNLTILIESAQQH